MKKYIILLLFFLAAVIFSAAAGFIAGSSQPGENFFSLPKPQRFGQTGLINPLLDYEVSQNLYTGELKSFRTVVQNEINKDKDQNLATDVSVYFRDMQDGPWFGINEGLNFSPASLLKVVVLITYLKEAEQDPGILSKKLTYNPGNDANDASFFKPAKAIEANKSYTVDTLLSYMIEYSDNNALDTLVTPDFPNRYIKTFKDFGIEYAVDDQPQENIMSARAYTTFFRALYNSSYLDRAMSEKALELLSHTELPGGIKAGIPKNITFAGKFGERTIGDVKQLHDCGIVYYPRNPYLLCVMTRGDDFNNLEKVIKNISKITWQEVDKQVKSSKH